MASMSIFNPSAVFIPLGAVLLLAAAYPTAGQTFNPMNLANTSVTGRLCCSTTGNCGLLSILTPPLRNVPVLLNCTATNGSIVTVGQSTTNTNGNFNITVGNLTDINPAIPCRVVVNLPINSTTCRPLSNITGVLQATVTPITNIATGIVGGVLNLFLSGITGIFQVILPGQGIGL